MAADLTLADINAIFDKLDFNQDDKIDYYEFIAGSLDKSNVYREENLKAAFARIDADGSGSIS